GLSPVRDWWKRPPHESAASEEKPSSAERVPDRPDSLRLPRDVTDTLRIQTAEARPATRPRGLELSGKLAVDTNRPVRVHTRFAGEVVRVEPVEDTARPGGQTAFRPLRPGDRVEENQLLAVVWSKDLGEKKSELVDALSRLQLDQALLDSLRESFKKGVIPERSLREKERDVEAGRIAVDRAERTLRAWRLTDEGIEAVRAEAGRHRGKGRPDRPQGDGTAHGR